MPIIWRESMAIGHPTIDTQHKYLFCLVNAVELALQLEDAVKVTGFYLDQLIDYTRSHFEDEEKIQTAMNYPHYHEHKTQHREILENLVDLKARLLPESKTPASEEPETTAETVAAGPVAEGVAAATAETRAQADSERAERLCAQALEEVVGFLRHWILDHVLHTDIQMKPYLQMQKVDPTRKNPVFRGG